MAADGKTPLKENGVDVTMKDVCAYAVLTPDSEDTVQIKLQKYRIFQKLNAGEAEIALSSEEITMIKNCVGKYYSQLIVGQIFDMLEGEQ